MKIISYLFLTLCLSLVLANELNSQVEKFLEVEIDRIEEIANILEDLEIKDETFLDAADSAKDSQFADFLNAAYGSNLGTDILKKCSKPYSPDSNSHETFIEQYTKVNTNINTLITKKTIKEITGQACQYNVGDASTFISAKKAEIPTMPLFSTLLAKTSFAKGFFEFSKCIGVTELNKIADPALVAEITFILSSDKLLNRLFESFCSVNNIFHYFGNKVDAKDSKVFHNLGTYFHDLMVSVKLHADYIKSKP